jgi:hypothetical protein
MRKGCGSEAEGFCGGGEAVEAPAADEGESVCESKSSMDSTWRREEESRFLLREAAAVLDAPDEAALWEGVMGKLEVEARLGVAGVLPPRLTGFHDLEDDSATRVRKVSMASSRAASHCALDFWSDKASSILTSVQLAGWMLGAMEREDEQEVDFAACAWLRGFSRLAAWLVVRQEAAEAARGM